VAYADELDVDEPAWNSPIAESKAPTQGKILLPRLFPDDVEAPAPAVRNVGRLLQVRTGPKLAAAVEPPSGDTLPRIFEAEDPSTPITEKRGIATWTVDSVAQFGIGVAQALNSIPAAYLASQAARLDMAKLPESLRDVGGMLTTGAIPQTYANIRRMAGASRKEIAEDMEATARGFMDRVSRLEEKGKNMGGLHFGRTAGHALAGLLPYVYAGPAAPAVIADQVFGSTWLAAKDSYKSRFPELSDDEAEAKAIVPATVSAIGAGLIWHYIPKLGRGAKGSDLLRYLTTLKDKLSTPKEVVLTLLKHMGITGATAAADTLQQQIVAKATYNPDMTLPEIFGHTIMGGAGMAALTGVLGIPRLATTAYRQFRTPARQRELQDLTRSAIDREIQLEREAQSATTEKPQQEGVQPERPGTPPQQPPKAEGEAPVPPADAGDRVQRAEAERKVEPRKIDSGMIEEGINAFLEDNGLPRNTFDNEQRVLLHNLVRITYREDPGLLADPWNVRWALYRMHELGLLVRGGFLPEGWTPLRERKPSQRPWEKTGITSDDPLKGPLNADFIRRILREQEQRERAQFAKFEGEAMREWLRKRISLGEPVQKSKIIESGLQDLITASEYRESPDGLWYYPKGQVALPAEPQKREEEAESPAPGAEAAETTTPTGKTLRFWEYKEKDPSKYGVLPNWKLGADPRTGEVEPIQGKFDPGQYDPILIWEDQAGKQWVFSGRHRFRLWQRSGKGQPIAVKLFKEKDGWTRDEVALRDITDNAKSSNGTEFDYGVVWRDLLRNFTRDQARDEGLLRYDKSRIGFDMAREAAPEVFTAWMNTGRVAAKDPSVIQSAPRITTEQALAIIKAAPDNKLVQRVGLRATLNGDSKSMVELQMEAAKEDFESRGATQAEQGELLDELTLSTWRQRAAYVDAKIRSLDNKIGSFAGPVRSQAEAAAAGVRFEQGLPQAVIDLKNLILLKKRWKNWATDAEIKKDVYENAIPKVATTMERALELKAEVDADLARARDEWVKIRDEFLAIKSEQASARKSFLASENTRLEKAYDAAKADAEAYKRWFDADPTKTSEPPPRRTYRRDKEPLKQKPKAPAKPVDTEQVIIKAIEGIRSELRRTDRTPLLPGQIGDADLRRLTEVAGAMVDQSFRTFAQRMWNSGQDVWDYTKDHLRAAWNAKPGGEPISIENAKAVIDEIIAEKSKPKEPVKLPRDTWREKQSLQVQENYDALLPTAIDWYRERYGYKEKFTGREKEFGGARIWAQRLALGGYRDWLSVPEDFIAQARKDAVAEHKKKGVDPLIENRYTKFLKGVQEFARTGRAPGSERVKKTGPSTKKEDRIGEDGIERLLPWDKLPDTNERWMARSAIELLYSSIARVPDILNLSVGQLDFVAGLLRNVIVTKVIKAEDPFMMMTPASAFITKRYVENIRPQLIRQWGKGLSEAELKKVIDSGPLFPDPKNVKNPIPAETMLPFVQEYSENLGVRMADGKTKFNLQALRGAAITHLIGRGFTKDQVDMIAPHGKKDVLTKYYIDKTRIRWREQFGYIVNTTGHNLDFMRLYPKEFTSYTEKGTHEVEGVTLQMSRSQFEKLSKEQQAIEVEKAKIAARMGRPRTEGELPLEGALPVEGEQVGRPEVSTMRRFTSTNDLLAALDSPNLKLTPEARAMLRSIITSKMAEAMPDLVLEIRNMVGQGQPGQYDPNSDIIRLAHFARAEHAVEEFMHRVFRFLKPDDKAWVRDERQRALDQEIAKREAKNETDTVSVLRSLKERQFTTDEWIDGDLPRDLYKFSNDTEYFHFLMQRRATPYFTKPETKGFVARIREVFNDLWQTVKRLIGLSAKEDDLWHSISTGTYEYDVQGSQKWALKQPPAGALNMTPEELAALSPEQRQRLESLEPTAEKAYVMGVDVGAWKPFMDIVRGTIDRAKSAVAAIDKERLVKTQRRTTVGRPEGYLWQIFNAVVDGIKKSRDEFFQDPKNYPKGPLDENLGDYASRLGIEYGAGNVERAQAAADRGEYTASLPEIQAEIQHEQWSRGNMRARQGLEALNQLVAKLGPSAELPGIKEQLEPEFKKLRARLDKDAAREETNEEGQSVSQRGKELYDFEEKLPEYKALSKMLQFQHVVDALLKPNSAMNEWRETLKLYGKDVIDFVMPGMPRPGESARMPPLEPMRRMALRLMQSFEKMDGIAEDFNQNVWLEGRVEVAKRIKTLADTLKEKTDIVDNAETLILEVLNARNKEKGYLGTVKGQMETQYLKDSYALITDFAERLREQFPNNGAEIVLFRLLNRPEFSRARAARGQIRGVDRVSELKDELNRTEEIIVEADSRLAKIRNDEAEGKPVDADEKTYWAEWLEYAKVVADVKRRTAVTADALARIIVATQDSKPLEDRSLVIARLGRNLKARDPILKLEQAGKLLDITSLETERRRLAEEVSKMEREETKDLVAIDEARKKIAELDVEISNQTTKGDQILEELESVARSRSKDAMMTIKFIENELAKARIDLKALDNAKDLFESFRTREVEGPEPAPGEPKPFGKRREPNPEYWRAYNAANEVVNGEWIPILGNGMGNSPHGVSIHYMPWKQWVPDETGKLVLFEHPLLSYKASDSPLLDADNFKQITGYFDKAREFTEAVKESRQRGDENLAIDERVYKGLLRMLVEHHGRHQDPTILSFTNKKKGLALEQKALHYAIFHSHLTVIRQALGLAARQNAGFANDYFNDKRVAENVSNKHQVPFSRTRTAALKSHADEFGRVPSVQEYAPVWAEAAQEGRRPGEPDLLRPGLYLPRSGKTVTKEDIDFIDENRQFFEDLRYKVTEFRQFERTPGEGPASERRGGGVRMYSYSGGVIRVDVREAVSVGERGLPMHLGGRGAKLVSEMGEAWLDSQTKLKEGDQAQKLDQNTDLTENSQNLLVRFWNGSGASDFFERVLIGPQGSSVRSLIGDAGRSWSDINYGEGSMIGRRMVASLQAVYAKLRRDKNAGLIRTLDDAVSETTLAHRELFPEDPIDRSVVAEYITGIVRQYGEKALDMRKEAAEVQKQETPGGGIMLKSEFTSPAAKFKTLSDWYDYGVLKDTDYILAVARSTHVSQMNYAQSLSRLSAALQEEMNYAAKNGGKAFHYETHNETARIKLLIDKLMLEFQKSYINPLDPEVSKQGGLLFDTMKTSLLANPPVPIRNFVLGAVMVWMKMRQLDRFHGILGALRTFRHVGQIAARIPLHMVFSPTYAPGRKMLQYFRGPGKRLLPAAVHNSAEKLIQSMIDANNGLETLGFNHRDPFRELIRSIWERTMIFATKAEADEAGKSKARWAAMHAWRGSKNVLRTMQAIYRLVGTEAADLHINAVSDGYYGVIDRGLREVARKYYDRIIATLGPDAKYDPNNRIFDILPGEFSNRRGLENQKRNLSDWYDFLVGTDVDLAGTLWKYGKEFRTNQLELAEINRQIQDILASGRLVPEELARRRDNLVEQGEPELFERVQANSVRAAIVRDFNAADAFNQPTAMINNRLFRMLATFQAWSSRFFVDFIRQYAGAKNQTTASRLMQAIPITLGYGLVASVLGLAGASLVDQYKRHVQGQSKRMVTALDKEFWSSWANMKEAGWISLLSTMPWLGDLALFVQNTVANNRGYEPTGRILVFNVLNSVLNTIRGMWNLRHDPDNVLNPVRDFALQYAGYSREISRAVGTQAYSAMKQRSAESVIRFRANALGLGSDQEAGATVRRGPVYTATSGMREDMYVAMVRRNDETLQETYKKLVAYYSDKGADNPVTNAVRDVRYMNPIVRAFGNKKPTADEWRQVYDGFTTDQRRDVDAAIENWNWAANLLNITFDPIAAEPSTGGGGTSSVSPAIGPVGGGSGRAGGPRLLLASGGAAAAGAAGLRRLSLRSRRPGARFGSRPSLGRSRLRLRRPRTLRVRRPRQRRLRYRAPTRSIA
jgi:site-specific recombinase XerD